MFLLRTLYYYSCIHYLGLDAVCHPVVSGLWHRNIHSWPVCIWIKKLLEKHSFWWWFFFLYKINVINNIYMTCYLRPIIVWYFIFCLFPPLFFMMMMMTKIFFLLLYAFASPKVYSLEGSDIDKYKAGTNFYL